MCNSNGETIDHLFLHCQIAQEHWGLLQRLGDVLMGVRLAAELDWSVCLKGPVAYLESDS